jgi:hypothetical protein
MKCRVWQSGSDACDMVFFSVTFYYVMGHWHLWVDVADVRVKQHRVRTL